MYACTPPHHPQELQRSTGAWRGLWSSHESSIRRTIRTLQKGTRLLLALCAEAKEKGAVGVAAKVRHLPLRPCSTVSVMR